MLVRLAKMGARFEVRELEGRFRGVIVFSEDKATEIHEMLLRAEVLEECPVMFLSVLLEAAATVLRIRSG